MTKKARVKKSYLDSERFFARKCLYAYRPTWEDLWWLILKLQGLKEKIAKGWTPTLYTYIMFLSQITSIFNILPVFFPIVRWTMYAFIMYLPKKIQTTSFGGQNYYESHSQRHFCSTVSRTKENVSFRRIYAGKTRINYFGFPTSSV